MLRRPIALAAALIVSRRDRLRHRCVGGGDHHFDRESETGPNRQFGP